MPQITSSDRLTVELNGTTVELVYVGRHGPLGRKEHVQMFRAYMADLRERCC